MPQLLHSLPKYRRHRASGQAVVTINGRDVYLGPHGTKASRREYDRVIAEWLAAGRHTSSGPAESSDLTIVELLSRYWAFAGQHYRKDGKPTAEVRNVKDAARPLRDLYGRCLAREFGPLKLAAVQQRMVESGLCRRTINGGIGRVRRIFRWAESQELVPASMVHALQTVLPLQYGRTDAPEPDPVRPIDDATVEATLRFMPPIVRDMVQFQRLTGCRPGEVCALRPCDIDRSTPDVWEYRPLEHKMRHRGRERVIFIGPKAQTILTRYLLRPADAHCFQPADSERQRREAQHEARKTPLSCGNVPGSNRRRKPRVTPGDFYERHAYTRAVQRASDVADKPAHEQQPDVAADERIVPRWHPNRLRHSAASEIRKRFGLEAAQVALGHSRCNTTEIYAERDSALAARVAKEVG